MNKLSQADLIGSVSDCHRTRTAAEHCGKFRSGETRLIILWDREAAVSITRALQYLE